MTCKLLHITLVNFTRSTVQVAGTQCNHCPRNGKPNPISVNTYRVIRKSLLDFQPLRYSSRDGHAEGEHVNRGRDTQSFYLTLQVLNMSTLGEATDVNPVIKFLLHTLHVCGRNFITGLTSAASPRVDISSTCKVGQKLGVSLPLFTCSPSA